MTTPAATENNVSAFNIQRVYLKGASLEMPLAPAIFLEQGEVGLEFNLATAITPLTPIIYEVALRATVTAKLGDKVQFLAEVDQAGIFELINIPQDQLQMALEINAATILTPYLRSNITDLLQRATLPMFMLPEINWGAAFVEKQKALAAQAAAEPARVVH